MSTNAEVDVDPEDAASADDLREAAQHFEALPDAFRGIADALRDDPEAPHMVHEGCCSTIQEAHAHGRSMGWFDGLRYAADLLNGRTL